MNRFKEDLNVAVITTKYVLNGNDPITNIFHHDDGFWEFIGNRKVESEDGYILVSLEEMINHDPSIAEVADLSYGKEARRKSEGSGWEII